MLCTFFLFLFFSLALSQNTQVDLVADKQLYAQSIKPGESIIYHLHGLSPNSHYESPTDFKMELLEPLKSYNSRDLLNTEKIMFTTDSSGYISDREAPEKYYRVRVTAKSTGVPSDKSLEGRPTQFNIVLETLFYGAPYDVFKLGVFVAVMCVLIATVVVPQFFPKLPAQFLVGSRITTSIILLKENIRELYDIISPINFLGYYFAFH